MITGTPEESVVILGVEQLLFVESGFLESVAYVDDKAVWFTVTVPRRHSG